MAETVTQIIFLGRGGQGAFTAVRLFALAVTEGDGRYAMAFPSFGPERRGAPVQAYLKIADSPVADRGPIQAADFLVVMDPSLVTDETAAKVKPGGLIILDSTQEGITDYAGRTVLSIDARKIAVDNIGKPITNTALLGALVFASQEAEPESISAAIRDAMKTTGESNVKAALAGYRRAEELMGGWNHA